MRTTQHKVANGLKWNEGRLFPFIKIKPLFMLLFAVILFFIYTNRQALLEKLDNGSINEFAIVGATNFTDDNDIRETLSQMGTLQGFWGQDIEAVKQQLETIPWVKSVAVRKVWPNRLSIWLTEYSPIAVWNGTEFLSKEGVIFQLPAEKLKQQELPQLAGPDYRSSQVLDAWQQIYADLKSKNLSLKKVMINDRGAWQIVLDNDVVLKLGRGEWKEKLDRFITIYPQIEVPENKKLSYVDLRYGVGAAIGIVDAN